MRKALLALTIVLAAVAVCFAQTETATVSGRVLDKSSAAVVGAEIVLTNVDTNAQSRTKTGKEGLYVFAGVMPGRYRLAAGAAGFSVTVKNDLVVHVQDELAENFTLQVGSVNEVVTVSANALNINTTDASVSTVVDQTYIKNMPLNGRSFQDLILLTPGIVTQSSQSGANFNTGPGITGEFSVNGQRTEANNYTVDGVSGNGGAAADGVALINGASASGSLPAATALGTTQALVSVDDLQEFRVSSSSYSAEYGRNPGGQFAFETKSGTNQWHGTAYDYVRNDFFDANDWFNNYQNVKEPALRQNDFGGTVGGPIRIPHLYNGKDKTFFFVSYEGLRLLQPRPAHVFGVPDYCIRGLVAPGSPAVCENSDGTPMLDPNGQNRIPAPAALQPVLNGFPLQNVSDYFPDGWAELKASWSDPSSIDSTSVRFDHMVTDRARLFFRFSDAESNSTTHSVDLIPSMIGNHPFTTRTYTGGVTSLISSRLNNEFRINYSSSEAATHIAIGAFDGSVPVDLAKLTGLGPSATVEPFFCGANESFVAFGCTGYLQGLTSSTQRQWNLVDTVSYSVGRHQLKFGADYRRLTPFAVPTNPNVSYTYSSLSSIENNNPDFVSVGVDAPAYPLSKNFSAFAQDEWRLSARLSLSMGLRWEVNPAPGVTKGLMPFTVQGSGPNTWAVAPKGTPLWKTTWFNFAPRLGAAYSIRGQQGWETVIRGGGGLFFDTGQQDSPFGFNGPGFGGSNFCATFLGQTCNPFPQVGQIPTVQDPTQLPPGQQYNAEPVGFSTHLQLPYTLQWNASVQQAMGKSQALTLSYVGSHSGRLLQTDQIPTPNNPNYGQFEFVSNGLTSDYHSAQAQFQRRLSRGLTALASYTWSHAIDYGSQNINFGYKRGNGDFDVRHNFSGAFSYDLPDAGHNGFANALLHHWGIDDRFTARTGFPVTIVGQTYLDPVTRKRLPAEEDLNSGVPLYIYGSNCANTYNNVVNGVLLPCPGGRAINAAAFSNLPNDPVTGQPSRAGNAPRNFVRGFRAWQMDLAVRREFPIYERLKLQFRAEAFNVFNHPNFGAIDPAFFCTPGPFCTFGQATATLANSLGILSPLYQLGGARSMQFALKAVF